MTFTLDTSGFVFEPGTGFCLTLARKTQWSDLSPFAQGYVEALFEAFADELPVAAILRPKGFSDLAPETLARIIADCAAKPKLDAGSDGRAIEGVWFYRAREKGIYPDFPRLTVLLGDDGKVRFAD